MESFDVGAPQVGQALAEQTALLLSRAYTGPERVDRYTPEERELWQQDIDRAQTGFVAMPAAWLERFPTMRNFTRDAFAREDSHHFYTRIKGRLAAHVGLFQRQFAVEGGEPFPVAFIEDVATDPDHRGEGLATALLERAGEWARAYGYDLCGLSTTLPEFYARLGWRPWPGSVTHTLPDGEERAISDAMVLPLTDEAEAWLTEWAAEPPCAGLAIAS